MSSKVKRVERKLRKAGKRLEKAQNKVQRHTLTIERTNGQIGVLMGKVECMRGQHEELLSRRKMSKADRLRNRLAEVLSKQPHDKENPCPKIERKAAKLRKKLAKIEMTKAQRLEAKIQKIRDRYETGNLMLMPAKQERKLARLQAKLDGLRGGSDVVEAA